MKTKTLAKFRLALIALPLILLSSARNSRSETFNRGAFLSNMTAIAPQPICAGVSLHFLITVGNLLPLKLPDFNGLNIRDLDKLSSAVYMKNIITGTDNIVEKLIKQ